MVGKVTGVLSSTEGLCDRVPPGERRSSKVCVYQLSLHYSKLLYTSTHTTVR